MPQRRHLVLIAVLTVVIVCGSDGVEEKLCQSIEIRSSLRHLEKLRNCTVIMGNLKIMLFDPNIIEDSGYEGYTFPELTEITGFLFLYKLHRLTSLGKLFPNLRVIQGARLYRDYAMVIYRLPDLQEVGLHNLVHIGRGGVMIDFCDKLCYANTVNWKALGADNVSIFSTGMECPGCPAICGGYCWSPHQCQKKKYHSDKCHPECIGCTKHSSANHCSICRNWEDHGTCVSNCPENRYMDSDTLKCLTSNECSKLNNGTSWIFGNYCINACPQFYIENPLVEGGCEFCGDKCVKICEGGLLHSVSSLEEMTYCTRVNGSLDMRLSGPVSMKTLQHHLGKIKEISGHVKIGRSPVIRSLGFFKSLERIEGETLHHGRYALFIYENQNLQKLLDDNQTLEVSNGEISFHDNPQLCFKEIEKFANVTKTRNRIDFDPFKYSNGEKAACNLKNLNITITENNPTNVTLSWEPLEVTGNETIIGYTIYYIETDDNITTYQSHDVCDINGWNSVFLSNTSLQIDNLFPYTRYGYYIKIYSTQLRGEQTPVHYFVTATDDPTIPTWFNATAINEHAINLTWGAPSYINGEFSHYVITVLLEPDYLPTISQRNYCQHPHVPGLSQIVVPVTDKSNVTSSNCTCEEPSSTNIFKDDMMCSFGDNKCMKFMYQFQNEPEPRPDFSETSTDVFSPLSNMEPKRGSVRRIMLRDLNDTNVVKAVGLNTTSHVVENLQHFSLYIFFLQACNVKQENNKEQCGPVEMAFARTEKREIADDITDLSVMIEENGALVKWNEPSSPNSIVVSYQIEHRRVDLEHSKPVTECITRSQYFRDGVYKISKLVPGKYSVRVQAAALSGPGRFGKVKHFEIISSEGNYTWLYVLLPLFIISIIGGVIFWRWYNTKNVMWLTPNPQYDSTDYRPDQWELERDDVEIGKELGQGSFGTVHQGMIKSKNLPCAVKRVSVAATMGDRIKFLNEGCIMKTFEEGFHVVKLLGIVSRGQPPLVVMELMERGDLKSYLRASRESSDKLGNSQMYRMAAQIADGMAFLSAKKYVHRDLAARNCMVAADGTVKVGDFGMTRDIYETDYYRKGTKGLLPVRWMAPESLVDGLFTTDSDAWSYGVVLWEISTLAEQPYKGNSNEQVLHFVKSQGRLSRPEHCPDVLYDIMNTCWQWVPSLRPTFMEIVNKLTVYVGEDFKLVAFAYGPIGREYALNAGPRAQNPPAFGRTHRDEGYTQYNAADDKVRLFPGETNRPKNFLPFSSQRQNNPSPEQFTPGSPPSSSGLSSS